MANFSKASDEELLYLSRSGVEGAQCALDIRYDLLSKGLVYYVAPDLLRYFSLYELQDVGHKCYIACLAGFSFGQGNRFKAYFEISLKHAFGRERNRIFAERNKLYSLDSEIPTGVDITYHDVLPSDSLNDNPTRYVDYFEEVYFLGIAPTNVSPDLLKIARLKIGGHEFKEISEMLGIPLKKVYYRYSLYEEEVKKIIKKLSYHTA